MQKKQFNLVVRIIFFFTMEKFENRRKKQNLRGAFLLFLKLTEKYFFVNLIYIDYKKGTFLDDSEQKILNSVPTNTQ